MKPWMCNDQSEPGRESIMGNEVKEQGFTDGLLFPSGLRWDPAPRLVLLLFLTRVVSTGFSAARAVERGRREDLAAAGRGGGRRADRLRPGVCTNGVGGGREWGGGRWVLGGHIDVVCPWGRDAVHEVGRDGSVGGD